MKNQLVAKSCRICLTETKKLRSLYKPIDEGDEPPNKMLHLVTGIIVEKPDEHETLPKNICKNCELSLSMAFEFRENALKTQQIIETYLKQLYENDINNEENKCSISILNKMEYEDIMNLEPLDCVNTLGENIEQIHNDEHKYSLENGEELNEGDSCEEEETNEIDDIYTEDETAFEINESKANDNDENYFDHQQDDDQDNEENQIYDDHEVVEYQEEQVEIMSAEEENYTITQRRNSKSTKRNKKKISKITIKHDKTKENLNNTFLPENVENMKLIPRRGRKPSKNTNKNAHICDICGNVFAKRGRMMEHRQRHDKECQFCCEICDKKFLTRELLRKHMFSHSGGKPLKCGFCSRTFYYESVRKAHEAVHKGHRPYICDVCGKGFSYAHALKKHKLIHAEIKLYRCEYCHKDFRLQHHMKQHELTKLHQNAVLFAQSGNISLEDCGEALKGDHLEDDVFFIEDLPEDQINGSS